MKLVDSHIHVGALPLHCEVLRALAVSIYELEWDALSILAKNNQTQLVPAFGIHPWFVSSASSNFLFELEMKLKTYPGSLVGEIGLDATSKHIHSLQTQESVFFAQLELANKLSRSISLHLVGGSAISSICQYLKKYPLCRPPKISIHSFCGSLTQLKQLKASFGKKTKVFIGVSRKLSGKLPEDKLKRLILEMEDDRILVESDEETPHQQFYISDLEWTIEVIAQCKNWTLDEAASILYENFLSFISSN